MTGEKTSEKDSNNGGVFDGMYALVLFTEHQ
jgi:hypothetical protein